MEAKIEEPICTNSERHEECERKENDMFHEKFKNVKKVNSCWRTKDCENQ
jgi:hypothetical protein